MGTGNGRDFSELIPGKNKTVRLDQPLINYVLGGLIFLAMGVGLLGLTIFIVFYSTFNHEWAVMALVVATLPFGWGFTAIGFVSLRAVIDCSRCLTLEALSRRLNVSEDALIRVTIKEQILPRYDVRGRIVYRPGDIDSLSLLCASKSPIQAEGLLRVGANKDTSSDLLLRRSDAPESSPKPDSNPSSE